VGLPLPNTEARIVDPVSGVDLAAGEVGELMVKGPQVMAGYWGEEAGAGLREGWLCTGDLALRDSDGFFRIIGRREDAIHLPEGTVYPARCGGGAL
jgi:long-chain acyl-CoA synthetase